MQAVRPVVVSRKAGDVGVLNAKNRLLLSAELSELYAGIPPKYSLGALRGRPGIHLVRERRTSDAKRPDTYTRGEVDPEVTDGITTPYNVKRALLLREGNTHGGGWA